MKTNLNKANVLQSQISASRISVQKRIGKISREFITKFASSSVADNSFGWRDSAGDQITRRTRPVQNWPNNPNPV